MDWPFTGNITHEQCAAIVNPVLKHRQSLLNRLADFMAAEGLTPQECEIVCLWLAGTSHGMRGEAVTNDLSMYTLGAAWQYAATKVAN